MASVKEPEKHPYFLLHRSEMGKKMLAGDKDTMYKHLKRQLTKEARVDEPLEREKSEEMHQRTEEINLASGEAMYRTASENSTRDGVLVGLLEAGECFPARFDLPLERICGFAYTSQQVVELFAIPTNMLMDRFNSYRKQAFLRARANAEQSIRVGATG